VTPTPIEAASSSASVSPIRKRRMRIF
jgi:hypothetical protein